MFRGAALSSLSALPRHQRRLAVLAQRTRGKKSQQATFVNAQHMLRMSQSHKPVPHAASSLTPQRAGHADTGAELGGGAGHGWVYQQASPRNRARGSHVADGAASTRRSRVVPQVDGHKNLGSHQQPSPNRYDEVDSSTGDSKVQAYFDELVRTAMLQFGPPLPAEFVADNHVMAQSDSSRRTDSRRASTWRDAGADGTLFHMYDEVAVKTSELLAAIRRVEPGFSFNTHCDGIPFALLIKNCSYLRAFGGKVNMMRYVTRSPDGRLLVSLAKYKMREVAPQDGIRQGPQPWLYGGRM